MKPLELAGQTVVEMAGALQSGVCSVEALVEAVLAQVEAREPALQAWAVIDREGALRAARAADVRRRAGFPLGPLHGVPFGVKDIFDVAGLPTQAGFAPFADRVAAADSFPVAQLRAAGAIPLGKTHTTQFAFADPAPTRNPHHPDRTPGGSSSGSAAAVGAGTIPAALGSQTAGSVLRPAGYCGAVGFKPTWGRISLDGVLPFAWSLDHVGVMARTVADCVALVAVLAGEPWERVPKLYQNQGPLMSQRFRAQPPPDVPPRLLLLEEFVERSDAEMAAHIEGVARRLMKHGATVTRGRMPATLDHVLAVHGVIMAAEAGAAHADLLREQAASYGPRLRSYVEVGLLVPAEAYLRADRLRTRLLTQTQALLDEQGVDALLLPTASAVAPDRATTGDRAFQAPWSLLGMPAISLPTGRDAQGLPFATQLVGAHDADAALLATARWVEAALG